jgi:hypothetical protein
MTKRELINKIEALEVGVLNDDMSEDEKEYHRDIVGSEPEPFIAITFDNPDYEDEIMK